MSTNDYVKYVAEQLIQRLETPKSERREKKKERKESKDPFLHRWFGLIPYALMILVNKRNRK
ncbi:YqzE family protein [Siminovitchia sediminis]|uniref:YqzE family protein n=1 Tax=Siminovitchia sediminis TaxID=1274353 RepID=A0ABW4KCZ1_9BACI